jgi:hypothetical protein
MLNASDAVLSIWGNPVIVVADDAFDIIIINGIIHSKKRKNEQ